MQSLATFVTVLTSILILLIIARVLLSWFPSVQYGNPAVKILTGVVDPILMPFRRLLPTFGGIDFSPLIAILGISLLNNIVGALANPAHAHESPIQLVFDVVLSLVSQIALIFAIVVGIRLVLVAVQDDQFHPASYFVRQLTDPLLRPFRNLTRSAEMVGVIAFGVYLLTFILIRIVSGPVISHV